MQDRSIFRRWLHAFAPQPVAIHWSERLRSCLGALIGIGLTAGLMRLTLGENGMIPFLVAPMGASAVLLFAVPASPLAQPWSLIGGNIVSATIGVACARFFVNPADAAYAASLAIALSIAAMFALRCVHPPSGAVALTAVLGGPPVHALGFGFVLAPIALQSGILLIVAIAFHRATRHRYPHVAAARETTQAPTASSSGASHTAGALRSPDFMRTTGAGTVQTDLDAVLARRNELLDITRDDLVALLQEVQSQSRLTQTHSPDRHLIRTGAAGSRHRRAASRSKRDFRTLFSRPSRQP